SIEESPVFNEAKAEIAEKQAEASHMPLLEVIKNYPREVFIAMGMRMAENISYYIFTIVVITYITEYAGQDKGPILQALLIGSAVHFVWIPIVGAISDKVGRRPLYLLGAVGVAVWAFPFFNLVTEGGQGNLILAVVVGLMLHALMYSPQAAFFSELFGTSVRYTGASVGYQLASIFAGALAPIIALKLLGTVEESNTTAVALYVCVASAITVVAVLFAKETRASSLRHDRVVRGAHV
ncbi:MAG TPA: MFS transporter, partial [Nocardioidaceae bacterium]